jgi:hypothetical protein
VLPVTVMVYVPAGVPGLLVLPPPPPPHPAIAKVSNIPSARATDPVRSRLTPGWLQFQAAQAAPLRNSASITRLSGQGVSGRVGGKGRERGALTEGAVVVTVTVTFVPELLGVSEVCESWQVASEGAPVQAKLTA